MSKRKSIKTFVKNQSVIARKQPADVAHAVVATDVVLFTIRDKQLHVLLIDVNRPPYFVHVPGFPGGLILPDETAEQSARRHLQEKARIDPNAVYLEQLYTFSALERDPRSRVIAVAYLGLIPFDSLTENEHEDVWWCPVNEVPDLAYDHTAILTTALERLRARISYTNIIACLMPQEFTLTELQTAYEIILEKQLDKRNFRKKLAMTKLVKSARKTRRGEAYRPAQLYVFADTTVKIVSMF